MPLNMKHGKSSYLLLRYVAFSIKVFGSLCVGEDEMVCVELVAKHEVTEFIVLL